MAEGGKTAQKDGQPWTIIGHFNTYEEANKKKADLLGSGGDIQVKIRRRQIGYDVKIRHR